MRGALWWLVVVCSSGVVLASKTATSASRLPRTSAGQLAAAAAAQNKTIREIRNNGRDGTGQGSGGAAPSRGGNGRAREQYMFDVFEAIISTLESKLQRIENLDKAVEHLMRRVEGLDTRVNSNIDKTESVISKLRTLDSKLFQTPNRLQFDTRKPEGFTEAESVGLNKKLVALDRKVSDIDDKLSVLKNQLDTNSLQGEDINAEASEKRSVSMNVVEITKALNTEVIDHVTKELGQLRDATGAVDRKLQFHINLVQENLGKVLNMMTELHRAVIGDSRRDSRFYNRTTTEKPELLATTNSDDLVQQVKQTLTVSEKMDEVWNVVVGTKSSVDDLVPKSDELLTQTQRQERAIGEIHNDLKTKTNKIIANLDKVEKRLKKQEDDVATLAQKPVPAEILLDPSSLDNLEEYESARFVEDDGADTTYSVGEVGETTYAVGETTLPTPIARGTTTERRVEKRKGGVIFPSVKKKPTNVNSTFITADVSQNIKDVKGYSCVDFLSAGMRHSGVYYLQIRGTTYWFLKVFCEQEVADGGWTVIQRRDDFGYPRENFNRDWNDYKNGFGDPAKEFWLGNENIYMLTNNEEYSLRVELEDFEGTKRYAQYSHFKIYSEADYYKLEIDGYEGNAGDSLNDPWYGSNNSPFSTYNRDNDRSSLNCASMLKGGWWWKSCGRGLNGLYLNDPQDLTARQGIVWFRWKGWDYTLKKSVMMIKPRSFVGGT
ncbi:unnamed protein product [Phaedon cochleariae]|uniref:Fibrinogen C-terminal domain-containing protein n=1 Tax=Phaedon cochleariae TaxID=80249 RepID=A0A9P0DX20_PHACE|nr:unnamed protein product [Phaedon cochleariae]